MNVIAYLNFSRANWSGLHVIPAASEKVLINITAGG